MKKQVLNLGEALSKVEQKSIKGGVYYCGDTACPSGLCCNSMHQCAVYNEELNVCPPYVPGSY
ncbi:hypothetical protein [Tenacibaculum sp.]|uniref:hypothetical protein n=1 Tax=Tenacibaculum sp. TaxID=1906242 RepID=UPI003AA7AF33